MDNFPRRDSEDSENHSSSQSLPSNKHKFVSLINAAVFYFDQVTPLTNQHYLLQKSELETKIKKASDLQGQLRENYFFLKTNCDQLISETQKQEKNIQNAKSRLFELSQKKNLKEAGKKKVLEKEAGPRPRRSTQEIFGKSSQCYPNYLTPVVLSEESDEVLSRFEIEERLFTYN